MMTAETRREIEPTTTKKTILCSSHAHSSKRVVQRHCRGARRARNPAKRMTTKGLQIKAVFYEGLDA
eukprot:scaffold114397_cov28-Tisochrysis_lutea.AAC.6